MRDWVRRRLEGDDGMSMVEILVAIMILTVALFALLGSFIASAHSLQEQERRSVATRVATEALEQLRNTGFADLDAGTDTEVDIERAGIDFTVRTEVEWLDALDGAAGAEEDVKFTTVTVAWDLRGEERSVSFSTAVSALIAKDESDDDDGDKTILTVSASPDPNVVDDDGQATEDVTLRLTLDGYDTAPTVKAEWTNHATGDLEAEWLTTVDGQNEWVSENVAASRFHQPDDDDDLPITFTVIDAEGTLTRGYELRLIDGSEDILDFSSVTIQPSAIHINSPHTSQGCEHPNQNCRNADDVTFRATVSGLDPDNVDSVKVRYLRRDGSHGELALIQNPNDSSVWRRTLPANSERFKVGSSKSFTFIVTSVTTGVSTSTVQTHPVLEV